MDADNTSCDHEPVGADRSDPAQILAFTADERHARLLAVAQDCGYADAHWRATKPEDITRFRGQVDPSKFSTVLDAGENAVARYGPLTCFKKIGMSPLFSKTVRVR